MSNEELPNDFDIVLLGTGLVTTITAAAFSRIGLKVLHLDRNDYYGSSYANFNLDAIETWKKKQQGLCEDNPEKSTHEIAKESPQSDAIHVCLPKERQQAFNLTSDFHVRERTDEEEAVAKKKNSSFKLFPYVESSKPDEAAQDEKDVRSVSAQNGQSGSNPSQEKESDGDDTNSATATCQKISQEQDATMEGKDAVEVAPISEQKASTQSNEVNTDKTIESSPHSNDASQLPKCSETELSSEEEATHKPIAQVKEKTEWTAGDMRDEWRRFCFDVSPKVLYCCCEMTELLIKSDVARYCEFRTVSRVLTLLSDKLEPVPCSRADVFGSKIVSLIEKRLMMKFLQFAADFENHKKEYADYKDSAFLNFLQSKKLTPNLQHFVRHAIAMADDSSNTEEGLAKTKKFLTSLGRYGNTAFLFPLYGSGELSQAFSRMSAVFGGVYCLMETATHILANAENNCCGIITSKGQRIDCKYLVAEASYLPSNYIQHLSSGKISRGIYITDASIKASPNDDLTLLNFICKQDTSRPVTVLEVPSSACVCPRNLFVVYFTRKSDSDDPKEDLREVRERLFADGSCDSSSEDSRPRILWSMHFTLDDLSQVALTDDAIGRVLVCSEGGDAEIDLDKCVLEAKRLFHRVCPDEEFLPAPPNPEDIIHVDDKESAVVRGEAGDFGSSHEFLDQEKREEGVEATETASGESACQQKQQDDELSSKESNES